MRRIRNSLHRTTRGLVPVGRKVVTFLERMGIPLLILGVGIIIVYFAAQQFSTWQRAAVAIPELAEAWS